MNESVKAVLGLLVAACALTGFFVWFPGVVDVVTPVTWWLRIGCPVLAGLCIAPLFWAERRQDKVPDFLTRITPRFFERDGFCFAVVPQVENGQCVMQVYFQNRYDRPCFAQVLLRGTSGLFSGRPDLPDIALGVSCGPAEFGCSTIGWDIPAAMQGRTISLSVYAQVKYPSGRGSLLRFRDGMRVGAIGTDIWREGLQVMGAISGTLVLSRPAHIRIQTPSGVCTANQNSLETKTTILWKLGSPVG